MRPGRGFGLVCNAGHRMARDDRRGAGAILVLRLVRRRKRRPLPTPGEALPLYGDKGLGITAVYSGATEPRLMMLLMASATDISRRMNSLSGT